MKIGPLVFGGADIAVIAMVVGICLLAKWMRGGKKRDPQYSPVEFGFILAGTLFIASDIAKSGVKDLDHLVGALAGIYMAFELVRSYRRLFQGRQQPHSA